MKSSRISFPSLCLVVFLCASPVFGQIAAGLRGRVVDPSGAGVPNAQVELTESAKNVHLPSTTSSSGDYSFSNLNPGSYSLTVRASGFARLEHSGITVKVGQTVTADLSLTLGGDQQTMTVE